MGVVMASGGRYIAGMAGRMWQTLRENAWAYLTWFLLTGALIAWGVAGWLDSDVVCRRWSFTEISGYVISPDQLCNPDETGRWGTSYARTKQANNALDGVKVVVGAALLGLVSYGVVLKARARTEDPVSE